VCVKAGTTAAAAVGTTLLTVGAGEGSLFEPGMRVYVTPNGAIGDYYTVASATATTITLEEGLKSINHPVGTGIYGIDERIYSVGTITSGGVDAPVLMVSIDGGDDIPLVFGVEKFDVKYLIGPCADGPETDAMGCTETKDEPADDSEWRQVEEVYIDATVRSEKKNEYGQYTSENGHINVKPRNLL
jgi:hypothetical protein